ncbi:MAG: sortase [Anaerolineae bacterium]
MDPANHEIGHSLRTQRRDAARARMRRLAAGLVAESHIGGRAGGAPGENRLAPAEVPRPRGSDAGLQPLAPAPTAAPAPRRRPLLDRVLLAIEVVAVIGLVATVLLSLGLLRRLQGEASALGPLPSGTLASVAARETTTPSETTVVSATATALVLLSPTAAALTPTLEPTPAPKTATALRTGTGTPAPVTSVTPSPSATASLTATGTPSATPRATPASPTGVRLVIAAIGVDAPVVEGDSWDVLKYGIGHRISSAWPGELGNCVLSAHNDVYGAIFKDLGSLEPGDIILAQAPEADYHYVVTGKRIVLPSDISVTDPTQEPTLTLITCYPPLVDTHRIVVTARLVGTE